MYNLKKMRGSPWAYPAGMIAGIFLSLVSHIFLNIEFGYILLLLYALYCFTCLIRSLFKRKRPWETKANPAMPLALAIVIFSFCVYSRVDLQLFFQKAKILTQTKFNTCREKAIPVGKLGFMAICEAREINLTPAMIEMIIYDSTGEIALENSRRSESWERAANSLHIPLVEPFPGSKVGVL
jgi:hypothetical protein